MIAAKEIPNLLTVLRGVLTVIIVGVMSFEGEGKYGWALGLFLVAALTDFLDGTLARRYGWTSKFGIIFDSMLDKVLILTMMLLLAPTIILPTAVWALLMIRELVVDSSKSYLNSIGKTVGPRTSGKLKMVAEVILVGLCLYWLMDSRLPKIIVEIMAGVTIGLAYYSGYFYIRDLLKKSEKTS